MEEEDRLQHQSHASPIQGMESVVATVSGYHGSERFNLIKLISHAGANYVGAMSKSITHLICWKFEGKKYSLAGKFKTVIVNHQWIEDSIKQGRRVPEESYILKSGQEVGPLLLEAPLIIQATSLTKNKVLGDRPDDNGSKKQTTELSSGASGTSVWEDSCFLNKYEEPRTNSSRQSRKAKRKISNSSGVANSAGPSRQGRRLVKNNVDEVVLDPLYFDLNPEDYLSRMHRLHTDAAASSSLSGGVSNNNILKNREGSDDGSHNQNGTVSGASNGIEQIKDSSNLSTPRISTLCVQDAPPTMEQTSIDECFEKFADGQADHVADLPTSTELSCVICLTEFSSTRGVLPCGHRFCYSCIQTWVDHRTTMGKNSTCPLCKSSFDSIIKYEDAAADQKVYSQTIPCGIPISDIVILMDREPPNYGSEAGACVVCRGREPEDLLMSCHLCHIRQIHSYCLDPPLLPWTCCHCKDLRMLYHNHSH